MKQEFKEWFISQIKESQDTADYPGRNYSFTNLHIDQVPFHEELKDYIFSLNPITDNTEYEVYHVHTWNEGSYFEQHIDNNFRRKWAYVCELQESECKTTLIVEGKETKEGIFDSNTLHEVPMIKKGTRISLTVFGSSKKQLL